MADLGFHRGVRRDTVYLNLVSEDNEENVSINWPDVINLFIMLNSDEHEIYQTR